jgi:hypothetical protein
MPVQIPSANTIPVTQQAHELFQTCANHLQGIAAGVDEARMHLVNTAMISESSGIWSKAVDTWGQEFWKIIQDTQDMADMLAQTVQIIQQNEGNQAEIATLLSQQVAGFNPP